MLSVWKPVWLQTSDYKRAVLALGDNGLGSGSKHHVEADHLFR